MTIYHDLPFDQAGGHGGNRLTTQLVVIHATFNTASDEAEAHYAEHRSDQVSAHFYADGDSIIQALDTDVVAYGCFSMGNARSVQFELCGLDWNADPPGPGAVAVATMRQAAPIVARVCRDYGIPIRKLGPDDLRAGVRGICGHADVTYAWGQGDHVDPGPAFPWGPFLGLVGGSPVPPPPPSSPPAAPPWPPWPGRYLRRTWPMMSGIDVRVWQGRMHARGWRIDADGWYGPQSELVCRTFQYEKHLTEDGIVGPVTWSAAWSAPIT